MCAFDDKRYLLEDGIHSLAYGHRDIPARVVDVVDEAEDGRVMVPEEAREEGIRVPHRLPEDPTLTNPNRPRCIWQQRREQRVRDGRQEVREQLGFADDEDDDDAALDVDDEEEEEEEDAAPPRTHSHSNPYILDSCAVSHSRRLD